MRSTLSRTFRALPTLLRIGVAETVAYRAEFVVWILTTTQPLIMMSLWTSVARDGSFKGYDADQFVVYFLATLLVRQLTGNWVAWQMMEEIRQGTMAMRLLRPIHPFVTYTTSHLAALPFRSAIALPLILILLVTSHGAITHDHLQLAVVLPSIAMAWLITFSILFAIGALAFFMTQTMALGTLYFGLFSLFSGYLMPLEMLPGPVARIADWLPFRFTLSVPVEILTKHHLTHTEVWQMLGGQGAWMVITTGLAIVLWNAGVRRFESVGG